MENCKQNIESNVSKNVLKNGNSIKYLAAIPLLSWILVALVFTVSVAANAGTGVK